MIPKFREGSWDENIFKSIVWFNEYKIPENLKEFLVVDIGGHIGSFTWLCDYDAAGCGFRLRGLRAFPIPGRVQGVDFCHLSRIQNLGLDQRLRRA